MAKTRRAYEGAGASTTLNGAFAAGATTFSIVAATGWPYGANPFFVVVEPGTSNEEKILVTRTNSGDLTLSLSGSRGADGTTDVTHADGSTVYPVFTATDADEANELASTWTTKGDIVTHGASTFERLAVGTDNYALLASSSASGGLAWGQIDTANLADDAVTTAKIVDAAATETKLAAAVVNKLVPAGTVVATIRSTADTGYLLLDGSAVASADSTYPSLWAVAPASWKSGTTLNLPDMSDKTLFGQSTTTLGATGGANSKTIASANLPTHTHTIDHGHADTFSANQSSHTHNVDPPNTTVTVNDNTQDYVTRLTSFTGTYAIPYDGNNDGYADNYTNTATVPGMAVSFATDHGHTASVNIGSFTSGSTDPSITVSGSVTDHSGSSGNGGFANTALDVTNAHLAVNFQIKAH